MREVNVSDLSPDELIRQQQRAIEDEAFASSRLLELVENTKEYEQENKRKTDAATKRAALTKEAERRAKPARN